VTRSSLLASSLAGFVALVGCSGKVLYSTGSGGGGGSETGGAASAEDGGASGSGGSVGSGGTSVGGSVGSGGFFTAGAAGASTGGSAGASCDQLLNDVENVFTPSADSWCEADDDCVYGSKPVCLAGCGDPIVSIRGAQELQARIDATAATCSQFFRQGCVVAQPPCVLQIGAPACVNLHCTNFVPAKWTSMTFEESTPTCPPASHCGRWVLTPDGTVTTFAGVTRFSPAQLQQVDAIAESMSFRQGFQLGFQCPATMTTSSVTLARELPSGQRPPSQLVTGCIFASPSQNDVRTLWNLVQAVAAEPQDAG
jgi:hypothetical protein